MKKALQLIELTESAKKQVDLVQISSIGSKFTDTEIKFYSSYNKIVILDSSKSANKYSEKLLISLKNLPTKYFPRFYDPTWSGVSTDEYDVPLQSVIEWFHKDGN